MPTILEFFLAAHPGQRGLDASAGVVALADSVGAKLGGSSVRAVLHDPAVLGGLAHDEQTGNAPPFVGLVEISLDEGEALGPSLDAVAAATAGAEWLDVARSAAVVGAEQVVVDGDQPLRLAMALRRRNDLTRIEFQAYWSTRHAELGRRVPGSQGYRQVHADGALWHEAVSATDFGGPEFDGVALAYYSDDAAFGAIMADPAVVEPLLEDERRFIDHSRSALVVGPESRNTSHPSEGV